MRFSRFASLTLAFLTAFLLTSPDADARECQGRARMGAAKSGHSERSVTRTRPDGTSRTSTHDSSRQRGGGKYSRDTVYTGPGGKQGTTYVEGAKTQDGRVRDVTPFIGHYADLKWFATLWKRVRQREPQLALVLVRRASERVASSGN